VGRPETEVQVEGLLRIDLAQVRDELDRLVDEVLREVVALLGRPGWLDRMVVVDELGIPLARVTAQDTVEALEAAPQRPAYRSAYSLGTWCGAWVAPKQRCR
jgi:hypothetical protein